MTRPHGPLVGVLILAAFAIAAGRQQDDEKATLNTMRARMYRLSSAEVWRAVPDALKAINVVFPKVNAARQYAVAWTFQPIAKPKAQRSELRVFVSPFAEPARVYVGSIMRDPPPDGGPGERVRYNAGELEQSFF